MKKNLVMMMLSVATCAMLLVGCGAATEEAAPAEEVATEEVVTEEAPVEEVVTEEEVVEEQPAVSDEIQQEEGVPLIQSVKQFNTLPLKLQGLIRSSLAQQNSAREADGEDELSLDRFLRTASVRRIISKFFKDPENAADVKAFNEKKAPAKPAEAPKAEPAKPAPTPTQSIEDKKADIERRRQEDFKKQGFTLSPESSATEGPYRIEVDKSGKAIISDSVDIPEGLGLKEWLDAQGITKVEEGLADWKRELAYIQFEVIDKVNAKYDAELAALEKPVVETEVVTDPLQPALDKISKAKSLSELDTILDEVDLDLLAEDPNNIDTINKAIESRKQELSKSVKYENVKKGDVLVFGDNKFGLVEKVTSTKLTVVPLYGERMTPAKDANKRITVLKKDFSKMVKSLYDTEANIVVGTKDVPAPSAEEKKIIETNSQNIDDFLDNEEATKKLEDQTNNKSEKDTNNDFFNNIGC